MYHLHFNEREGLLEARLSGFWELTTVTAFSKDLARIVDQYSNRFPNFPILFDSRSLSLLSAEVGEAFASAAQSSTGHQGRIAIVVKAALEKMQAQRLLNQFEPRFFTDAGDARLWLLGADGPLKFGTGARWSRGPIS